MEVKDILAKYNGLDAAIRSAPIPGEGPILWAGRIKGTTFAVRSNGYAPISYFASEDGWLPTPSYQWR